MSQTIDILCAIDVDDLPQLSQDRNKPTPGLNKFVYMIVNDANAISGQGGAELNISAVIGDNVRWRSTSLDGNFEYSVVFYNFTSNKGTLLSAPLLLGGIIDGAPDTIQETLPVEGPMPWGTAVAPTPYFYYQSTVEKQGKVTYQWWFQVNRTSDGSLIGYGMWDPFITIGN